MAHLRASRRGSGLSLLPSRPFSEAGRPEATEVTYLQDVIAGYEELTEKAEVVEEEEVEQVSGNATSGGGRRRHSARL